MSKAFTKEDDSRPEARPVRRPAAVLPPGASNYLTADGARRFREELTRLQDVERPQVLHASGDPSGADRVSELDERIQDLRRILRTATVVKPATAVADRVRFGATVRVRRGGGEESSYRIVGVDEADPGRGWVSWISPVAKALLNARLGDRVALLSPEGEEDLEVLSIRYEAGSDPGGE